MPRKKKSSQSRTQDWWAEEAIWGSTSLPQHPRDVEAQEMARREREIREQELYSAVFELMSGFRDTTSPSGIQEVRDMLATMQEVLLVRITAAKKGAVVFYTDDVETAPERLTISSNCEKISHYQHGVEVKTLKVRDIKYVECGTFSGLPTLYIRSSKSSSARGPLASFRASFANFEQYVDWALGLSSVVTAFRNESDKLPGQRKDLPPVDLVWQSLRFYLERRMANEGKKKEPPFTTYLLESEQRLYHFMEQLGVDPTAVKEYMPLRSAPAAAHFLAD